MSGTKKYAIAPDAAVPFSNNMDYCVGTGRMGLALQKEYMEQLKYVQDHIGFSHIRGHGLFCDDMAIYQEYEDENGNIAVEYNFTYLDRVMDGYRDVGIKPFLELGFMPGKLASGDQTVFYWKGNVTLPKDYEGWKALVQATLRHLMRRYGADEVVTWPIEVWNEPNLDVFWKGADMPEYFRLFKESFAAVKAVDPRFRVGGPAICGVDDARWMRSFLEFCRDSGLDLDFVTRHHYTSDPPELSGHYSYVKLHDLDKSMSELLVSREIVDSFGGFRGKEIHITEFNTSYVPTAPVHDTNYNAAYVAQLLATLGDAHRSYSYWTFGDVFEEAGVPHTPFHGGFGLVANGSIPKPSFWTFVFFKGLRGDCVHRSENAVIVRRDGGYRAVAWNPAPRREGGALTLEFSLPAPGPGEYCLITKTVDEECCNPLKLWHDMGEPAGLSAEEAAALREASKPLVKSRRIAMRGGSLEVSLSLADNAVLCFELSPVKPGGDRGFSYERVMRPV
jgi:xylan 1,4-beta-xylosidase